MDKIWHMIRLAIHSRSTRNSDIQTNVNGHFTALMEEVDRYSRRVARTCRKKNIKKKLGGFTKNLTKCQNRITNIFCRRNTSLNLKFTRTSSGSISFGLSVPMRSVFTDMINL